MFLIQDVVEMEKFPVDLVKKDIQDKVYKLSVSSLKLPTATSSTSS